MEWVNGEPVETQKTKESQDKALTFDLLLSLIKSVIFGFLIELQLNMNTAHGLNSVPLRGFNQQENTCLKFNVKRLIQCCIL